MNKAKSFSIRKIQESDQDFLFEMMYQAIYVKPGSNPPDRNIIKSPEIRKYVEDWGKEGDIGFIAVNNVSGLRTGAIWLRYFDSGNKSYGYISDHIPEMVIAVDYQQRGKGQGSLLIQKLICETSDFIKSISLSVDPDNPAARLYARFGFTECGVSEDSIIMRYDRPV